MDASTPTLAGSDPLADQAAPPVVAVMVTCDPGWWMEECLASLAAQDYPAFSVLVVDADSAEDPTARVAAVMPTAFVRRVRRRRGFGTAANEVLSVVEGASHFLFCHDDVSLDPSAVRSMVEEAFRANAGVVAPKLVGWFHPDRLLAVGMGMDGFGASVGLVERGDLDQEQHDAVRDVFFAPSPCSLVRADLFTSVGGFDTACGLVGEDLDLSWRAHLAGARVVTAPTAVVRHLEATDMGRRGVDGTLRAEIAEAREPVAPLRATPHSSTPVDEPWDEGWDDDDTPGEEAAAARRARHHASRRARREAEREQQHDAWVGEDGDWDDAEWSPRRRRRRQPERDDAQPVPTEAARGPEADVLDQLREVARLRAVISNYGSFRLVTHLPVLVTITVVGAIVHLWREGAGRARRFLEPWVLIVLGSGALRTRRRAVRKARSVGDREIIDLQVGGPARLSAAMRSATAAQVPVRRPDGRLAAATWIGALAVLGIGGRHLLAGHLPLIGELTPWPGWGTLASSASSGWRLTGLGVAGPAPTAFGLLTVAGAVLLGHMALLQHVVVLGTIPLGALGVYRLAGGLGSRRAQAVALVAYLAVPLPYDALARGRWSGLVAFAAAPWVFAILVRATGLPPFDVHTAGAMRPVRPPLNTARRIVAIALVTALAGAVQPGFMVAVVVIGVGLAAGAALTRTRSDGLRALVVAVVGVGGAVVLLFPWCLSWLPPTGEWAIITGPGSTHGVGLRLATLLRFQTGPVGGGVVGYALLIAAALPLIVGRAWRSQWAVRLWTVAIVGFGAAWARQHAALGMGWPPAEVLLAP
ncbi:MAG: glycosyltransferase, partial [Acidimicrobiales bacterium]